MGEFIIFFTVSVIFISAICLKINNNTKKEKANEAEKDRVLAKEMLMPKSYVKVTALDGIEEFFSDIFQPEAYYSDYYKRVRMTVSRHKAESYIIQSYREGYFEFGNVSIPVSQVKSVEILQG